MGIGDKVFWSIIIIVATAFVWLKFIDPFLSVWYSLILSGFICMLIFIYKGKGSKENNKKNTNKG